MFLTDWGNSYNLLSNLTQFGGFANNLEEFERVFTSVIFEDICELYVKQTEDGICDLEMLNSGLETLSIFVAESAKEILSNFQQYSFEKSKGIFSSQKFSNLGNFFEFNLKMFIESMRVELTYSSKNS
jgi:hypothetical protein